MKALHTGDWHIGTFKGPELNGVNLRSLDTKDCLDAMLERAREECPELVLVSGDIFHTGKTWSDRCCEEVITAIDIITKLSYNAKQVIVMRGTPNHDGDGQFRVLQTHFAEAENVHIVVEPVVISTNYADVAVIPGFDRGTYRAKFPGLGKEEENEVFSRELGNIVMGLRAQCREDHPAVLMAHYTVPGCNMESGQTQILTQFEPVIPTESLDAADYDLVALGHIHRPQQLQSIKNAFYSGSINANNFNDEGQERGFWIHHFEQGAFRKPGMVLTDSEFIKTPYREFLTIHLTDADITAINLGNIDEIAMNYWRWNGAISGKIVRVLYECTADKKKAFNSVILAKTMYDDGAFFVWDILPEKVNEFANKTEFTDVTDPEVNLAKYFEEKQVPPEKIEEFVLKARPVITEAEANMTAVANTGMFEPVEISVKNYRNYEEESFNFEDISFCTINGPNGAGKSSLFMDAIIDCLYEETREGEKTGWIRNDEKARSGSIMFSFRIGEKIFRVTRTRARSGKGTLNIAQLIDEEWIDCSKEKYADTQQEIVNIVGMNSFTFKSCALIMQDQYGLFLQAKPEERVEVLGTLLGLGIYKIMERIASDKAKANGAKVREIKQEIEIHLGTIDSFGDPQAELEICTAELNSSETKLKEKTAERDNKKLILTHQKEAVERRNKLLAEVRTLQEKKDSAEQNRVAQQAIVDSSTIILDSRTEIEAKVAEHKTLLERELELAGESALYASKKQEAENLAKQAVTEQQAIDRYRDRAKQKENELSLAQPTDQDAVVKENAAEYDRQKKLLDEEYEKERRYRVIEQELIQARHSLQQLSTQHDADIKRMQLSEDGLKKKAELLSNVECVDIDNAKCGFLSDAIAANKLLETYPEQYAQKRKAYEAQADPYNQKIEGLEKQLADIDYDAAVVAEISEKVKRLKPYVTQLEAINQREGKIALLKADIQHLQSNIAEAEKRLSEVKLKGIEAEQERDRYAKAFEEHAQVLSKIVTLEPWLEKEKQLPVAEERNTTALNRIVELTTELADIDAEIAEKQEDADKESLATNGVEELQALVNDLETEILAVTDIVKNQQMKIGALKQKTEQIEELKKEINILQECKVEYAKETAVYDELKVAFSQSGVPHQIIRSIIPQLTDMANSILSQMTGGKMGVDFRLERLQKNGKEKTSLDIFIEECGKSSLPYLSKSGGEKVKASLAVILSLAEMKAYTAGVQFGFLQIDEPPFLDSDGTQAYVDSLEAIRKRYPNIKIMAITHDQEFKARFPQSVTVYKDEQGSHVRWD